MRYEGKDQWRSLSANDTAFVSRYTLLRLLSAVPRVGSRIFGYFLFFVQFLDMFYNDEFGAHIRNLTSDVSKRIPPAPHMVCLMLIICVFSLLCKHWV